MLAPVPTADAAFDPAREEAELREYLGDAFEVERLWHYQETLADEVQQVADEQTLYRTSDAYLYNLTAFAMTGTKLPYLRELERVVTPGARVLDYGCGIGSDGLLLLEAGYHVEFADFANPSTEYLRWRLARRGLSAPVHDIAEHVPEGFEAAYAFDVIEHVDDPFAFLGEMERRARLVEVNLLEEEPDDQEIHHELPIGALLRHAAQGRVRTYVVLHERSHLVLYEPRATGPAARAESLARLAAGRLTRARR
jgi:SAM-dependent methyltransferase